MSSYTQPCTVHYKYISKQYPDSDNNLDTVDYTWDYDKSWREMKPETNVSIGQDNFLLLKIEIPASSALNENYDYLKLVELNFNIPNTYNLYICQLTDWYDTKPANLLPNTLKLPSELSDELLSSMWHKYAGIWVLGGSDIPVSADYVYIVLAGNKNEIAYESSTGLVVLYKEEFEYPNSNINISVVDNYNNSFTVNISHDFSSEYMVYLRYSRGGGSFDQNSSREITAGTPVELEYLNDNFDNEIIYIKAVAMIENNTSSEQDFYAQAEINQYDSPRITKTPILNHVFYSKINNIENNIPDTNVILEPQLSTGWRYLWETRAFNKPSKICGYYISIYKNNTRVTSLSIEYNKNESSWTVDNKNVQYSIYEGNDDLNNDGYLDIDEIEYEEIEDDQGNIIEVEIKYDYDSILFNPSDFGFKVNDKIKITVQAYSCLGENNTGFQLLSETVSSDEYTITGITKYPNESEKKNILKIKTSENTFETGEVLIKTAEGWKAALEVSIKTADGWKASIE